VLGEDATGEMIEKVRQDTISTEICSETNLNQASSPEIKQLLLSNTDKSFEEGGFGLPFFVATNAKGETTSFWGFENLDRVVSHLGLEFEAPQTEMSHRPSKL
jgi:hypothetical protein